jgi:hypothetical protein
MGQLPRRSRAQIRIGAAAAEQHARLEGDKAARIDHCLLLLDWCMHLLIELDRDKTRVRPLQRR